jgi:hypothetical protein
MMNIIIWWRHKRERKINFPSCLKLLFHFSFRLSKKKNLNNINGDIAAVCSKKQGSIQITQEITIYRKLHHVNRVIKSKPAQAEQ